MAPKAVHKRLYNNLDFLNLVAKTKSPSKRRKLLELANREQIRAICDCIKNAAYNPKIELTKEQKRALKNHKGVLMQLAHTKQPISKQKEILIQHGGFLSALIAPILGIAGSLLGDFFTHAV